MTAPELTFYSPPEFLGVPSGKYVLLTETGEPFPLPLTGALDEQDLESNAGIHQAPGSPGGVRTGFDTFKPLTLNFGDGVASLDTLLVFESELDAATWERAFRTHARQSVRVRDTVLMEEYDGWVSRSKVSKWRHPRYRKLGFTFQSVDSHGWRSEVLEVTGTPAVCVNSSGNDAFPYLSFTATATTVTVSDGTRTLTITTAAGHDLVVDSGRADGYVTDDGARANYSGRFPRIPAGGGTLTVTGGANVAVRYREPL